MRPLLYLALLLSGTACWGDVPARHLGRPLPNGCVVHAMVYMAGLDPGFGTAAMVKLAGGGGIPHVIVVVARPDGTRYGRDEHLGVFALGDLSPQAAYDQARLEAIGTLRIGARAETVGVLEESRSLRAAFDLLQSAGFRPERVDDVVVWRVGGTIYVYSPLHGCAEIQTRSRNLIRVAAMALGYWTGRS